MVDYSRFTDRSRKVMQLANYEAQRFNHEHIDTEHILLGLVKEGSGVAANVLKNMGIDLRVIRIEVEKVIDPLLLKHVEEKLPYTDATKRVIKYAVEESKNLGHHYIGTEHLLLSLLCEVEGRAVEILKSLGLKLEDVRKEVLDLIGPKSDCREDEKAITMEPTPIICGLRQLVMGFEEKVSKIRDKVTDFESKAQSLCNGVDELMMKALADWYKEIVDTENFKRSQETSRTTVYGAFGIPQSIVGEIMKGLEKLKEAEERPVEDSGEKTIKFKELL